MEIKFFCKKHIKSKHFKSVIQYLYLLMHWDIARHNGLSELIVRTGKRLNKIEFYFTNYEGNRFPRNLIYKFIASYKREYDHLTPSETTLNNVFRVLIYLNFVNILDSEYDDGHDFVIDDQLCVFIEDWARHIHSYCERDLFNLLENYFQKPIAA